MSETLFLVTAGRTSDGRYPVSLHRTRSAAIEGVRQALDEQASFFGKPNSPHPLELLDFGADHFYWGWLSACITVMAVLD